MRIPLARSRGFSLVELLAVIALIGLLITLIVPAVQMAREAARRARCKSNLRQIGLAFHNYHEQYEQFPPVYVATRRATGSVLPHFLGIVGAKDDANIHTYAEMLLPSLDQAALFEKIDFKQPYFSPEDLTGKGLPNYTADNESVVSTALPVLLCPSSPRVENPHEYTWTEAEEATFPLTYRSGGNDYGPSNGIGWFLKDFGPEQDSEVYDGVLSNNHLDSNLSTVTDGASQTSLMWEIAGRPQLWRRGTPIDGAKTGGGGWADVLNAENWFNGTDFDGSETAGPCVINCTNLYEGGTYSFHPGGVHVLLCDGSVRFLNESTNVAVFVQVVTRSGNTSVDGF